MMPSMEAETGRGTFARRYGRMRREQQELEFARIVAVSDGVFAIAITLLVLALEVPEGTADLTKALEDQLPDLFAFALSFAVLAKLWAFHHRFFSGLGEFDGPLVALNFLYLALIALVPFSSELIGDFGDDPAAVVFYAANLGGIGLTGSLMIEYAFRRELVKQDVAEVRHLYTGPSNWLVPGVFVASIPVALVSPTVATLMWLAIFGLGRAAATRLAHRRRK